MKIINDKYELYLEVALVVNQNMYNMEQIPYYVFKKTEEQLLKKISMHEES